MVGTRVIMLEPDYHCKCYLYWLSSLLTYYLSHLSSWTVVIVTVERAVYVALPITAKVTHFV